MACSRPISLRERAGARGAFRAAALNPECRRAVLRCKFVVPFFNTGGVAALRYISVIPRRFVLSREYTRGRKGGGSLARNHLVSLFSARTPLPLSPPLSHRLKSSPSDRCWFPLRPAFATLRFFSFLFSRHPCEGAVLNSSCCLFGRFNGKVLRCTRNNANDPPRVFRESLL